MKTLLLLCLLLLAGFGFVRYLDYKEAGKMKEITQAIVHNCDAQNNCSLLPDGWTVRRCDKYSDAYAKDAFAVDTSAMTTCASYNGISYFGNEREFVLTHHYITDGDAIAMAGKSSPLVIKKYFNGEFNRVLYKES